jgi:hypothetical protein
MVLLAGENRKIVNIATLSTVNTTWSNSGATADLRSEMSATNSHSHGRAETVNLIKVHFLETTETSYTGNDVRPLDKEDVKQSVVFKVWKNDRMM